MTTTLPMELPKCPEHGIQMVLRPLVHQTYEQKFCGAWYDCPACTQSALFESPELRAQLAEMRNRSSAQAGLWDGLKGSNASAHLLPEAGATQERRL